LPLAVAEATLGRVPLTHVSDALHERVRRFALGDGPEDFETLALAIAGFQAEASPGFARLVAQRGGRFDSVRAIPAVPVAAFRLARVAVHAPELDVARFSTSGTTGSARGTHAFRTLETYRALALRPGARALGRDGKTGGLNGRGQVLNFDFALQMSKFKT